METKPTKETPRFCFIMRGVPGSGKSTTASKLTENCGVIHSTDQYFMQNGEYRFNYMRLQANHDKNFSAFQESLLARQPVVVCDNTNMKEEHYSHYIDEAQQSGYIVSIVEQLLPDFSVAAERNTKGIDSNRIEQMSRQHEPYDY